MPPKHPTNRNAAAGGERPASRTIGLFSSPEKRNPVLCLLLALATLALYNPVNRHPFVNYDDDRYVTENLHVRAGLTWNTVSWALTSTEQANWHPLTWMSHALDCSQFHLNPAGHHLTSLLVHVINVILLFLLLLQATGRAGPSLLVAALFALHPINVESVAWVAERKNVLCTLFYLLTVIAYSWYVRNPNWKRYLAVVALYSAGLASKPMVITLPFVLLLWDYWPLQRVRGYVSSSRNPAAPRSWAQLVMEKVPLFLLSAASAIITLRAQQSGGAVRSTAQFSLAARMQTAIYAYSEYLWKMIWPARLAPMYPHPGNSLAAWQVGLSALVLLSISLVVYKFRVRRYLTVGWLWFLGTLVPVIGLVQVGDAAMADRYAYIPLMGIFVMISFSAADFAAAKSVAFAWQAIPAAVTLLLLALVTSVQIGYWRSSQDLWIHTLKVTQNNFVAEDNLGGTLVQEGKPDEAFPHFEAADAINPRDPMSHNNLGVYLQTHGRTKEAMAQYQTTISLTSDPGLSSQAYANLGAAQRELGEDGLAVQNFDEAIRLNPNQANAWFGKGLLAEKQGKSNDAINYLSRSVELQPTGEGYLELGKSLEQSGRRQEALEAYRQALKLVPDLAEAQHATDALTGHQP